DHRERRPRGPPRPRTLLRPHRPRRRPAVPPRRRGPRRHARPRPLRPDPDLPVAPRRGRSLRARHLAGHLPVGAPQRPAPPPPHPHRHRLVTDSTPATSSPDATPQPAAGRSALRRQLARTMVKTIASYDLIGAGDRVLVAVSGGKDSYTLLDLLWEARA